MGSENMRWQRRWRANTGFGKTPVHDDSAAAAFAFLPRNFFSGAGLGFLCVRCSAEIRARTAVERSGLYPEFLRPAPIPRARLVPERFRRDMTAREEATAVEGADRLRVVMRSPEPESWTWIVFSLARPEYLYE